jgi:hypothetical protein
MVKRPWLALGLPELHHLVALVDGSSLRRREKGEGWNAVLTMGFNDWGKSGERPVVVLAQRRTEWGTQRVNWRWYEL